MYHYLINNFNYTEVRNTPIVRTGYSHLRVNFNRRRRYSSEAFAQYQYDRGRGLNLRTLTGGGLRVKIINGNRGTFSAGTGLMHEQEEWYIPEGNKQIRTVNFLKSTNYLSTRIKFNEQVELNGIVYYQTGYDGGIEQFRHRISGDANFMVKMTSKLQFKTSFSCNYENLPIIPITPFIYTLTNGVQLNF